MNPDKPSIVWRILQLLTRITGALMFDMKVWGVRNIPKTGGVLLLPNHQSFLDPVLIAIQLPRPISYMAKSELFEGNRFLAWVIRSLYAFPIKKQSADFGAIRQAIAKLHEGHILNMYPEGTRTKDGEIGPILPGVALVVRKAGVPIVPVYIDGSYGAWPKGKKMFGPHPIRILYGTPLTIEGLNNQQIVELIDRTWRAMREELRNKPGYGRVDGRVAGRVAGRSAAPKSISTTAV
jgi:1-acyl-sn-glycerol-3-phosphate acyltransferase